MYKVKVKDNYRWSNAKIGGIRFTKEVSEIGDSRMSEEIKNSSVLDVVKAGKNAGLEPNQIRARGKSKSHPKPHPKPKPKVKP